MKKLFLMLSCFCLALTSFAATDPYKMTTAEWDSKINAATNNWIKEDLTLKKEVFAKNPKTFAELCKYIDESTTEFKLIKKEDMKTWIPYTERIFLKEGFEYAKSKEGLKYRVTGYVLNRQSDLGLSDEDAYKLLLDSLVAKNGTISNEGRLVALNRFLELAATANVTTQKADLQKLNRIYTPKLISDKATWEPFVAKIRTALETY